MLMCVPWGIITDIVWLNHTQTHPLPVGKRKTCHTPQSAKGWKARRCKEPSFFGAFFTSVLLSTANKCIRPPASVSPSCTALFAHQLISLQAGVISLTAVGSSCCYFRNANPFNFTMQWQYLIDNQLFWQVVAKMCNDNTWLIENWFRINVLIAKF